MTAEDFYSLQKKSTCLSRSRVAKSGNNHHGTDVVKNTTCRPTLVLFFSFLFYLFCFIAVKVLCIGSGNRHVGPHKLINRYVTSIICKRFKQLFKKKLPTKTDTDKKKRHHEISFNDYTTCLWHASQITCYNQFDYIKTKCKIQLMIRNRLLIFVK